MSRLTLRLRGEPGTTLDMSQATPDRLRHQDIVDIARIAVTASPRGPRLGDFFDVIHGDRDTLVIEGGSRRLALVGAGLGDGAILTLGDVGDFAGCGMSGGALMIDGDAGVRTGDGMRRGVILMRGKAGARAGSRMIGGSIVAANGFASEAGVLMRRGCLIGPSFETLLPTFVDCGEHRLGFLQLLQDYIDRLGGPALKLPQAAWRHAGDMATIGRGELLQGNVL